MPKLNRILVPVDFSEGSRVALDYAAFVAKKFGASVDVLHVWETHPLLVSAEGLVVTRPGHPSQTLHDFVHSSAGREMELFLASLEEREHLKTRGRLESGDAPSTIVRLAGSGDYDLVVMGTHGRTGLSHIVMGSVAERVVRLSKIPVLTIKLPHTERKEEVRETSELL